MRKKLGIRYLRDLSGLDEFKEAEVIYRCRTQDLDKAILHLDRYCTQTQELIQKPDVWRAIRKLAKVLVVKGTMDADQVRTVLQS
jgi:hypothetical protein